MEVAVLRMVVASLDMEAGHKVVDRMELESLDMGVDRHMDLEVENNYWVVDILNIDFAFLFIYIDRQYIMIYN